MEHHGLKVHGYIPLESGGKQVNRQGSNVYYNPTIKGIGRYAIPSRKKHGEYEIISMPALVSHYQQLEMGQAKQQQPAKSPAIKGWDLHSEKGLTGKTSDPIYVRKGKDGQEFAELKNGKLQPISNKSHLSSLHKQHRETSTQTSKSNADGMLVKMGMPTEGRNNVDAQRKINGILEKIASLSPEQVAHFKDTFEFTDGSKVYIKHNGIKWKNEEKTMSPEVVSKLKSMLGSAAKEVVQAKGDAYKVQLAMKRVHEGMTKQGIIGTNNTAEILASIKDHAHPGGLKKIGDLCEHFKVNEMIGPPAEDYIRNPEIYEQKWGTYAAGLLRDETETLIKQGHLNQEHAKQIHQQASMVDNILSDKIKFSSEEEKIKAIGITFSRIQQALPDNMKNGFGNNMGETFAALAEVSRGGLVYMPSAGNAPLGDMIVLANREKGAQGRSKFVKVLKEGRGIISIKKEEGGQFSMAEFIKGLDIGNGDLGIDSQVAFDLNASKYFLKPEKADVSFATNIKTALKENGSINKELLQAAGFQVMTDENNETFIGHPKIGFIKTTKNGIVTENAAHERILNSVCNGLESYCSKNPDQVRFSIAKSIAKHDPKMVENEKNTFRKIITEKFGKGSEGIDNFLDVMAYKSEGDTTSREMVKQALMAILADRQNVEKNIKSMHPKTFQLYSAMLSVMQKKGESFRFDSVHIDDNGWTVSANHGGVPEEKDTSIIPYINNSKLLGLIMNFDFNPRLGGTGTKFYNIGLALRSKVKKRALALQQIMSGV